MLRQGGFLQAESLKHPPGQLVRGKQTGDGVIIPMEDAVTQKGVTGETETPLVLAEATHCLNKATKHREMKNRVLSSFTGMASHSG